MVFALLSYAPVSRKRMDRSARAQSASQKNMHAKLVHPMRKVRSFVRRDGRITPSQQRALEELWPLYGIEPGKRLLALDHLFENKAPTVLEIGFGNGETLIELAKRDNDVHYIGAEVYRSGVGHLLLRLQEEGLRNVKVYADDAIELLRHNIPKNSLAKINLFFPDPWHKKKHHKRRIVNEDFIALVHSRLERGGVFHFATDWEPYAEWTMARFEAAKGFKNLKGAGKTSPRPTSRPITKFEKRGFRLGHSSWDLLYQKR